MTAACYQPQGNGVASIIGIGHKVDWLFDSESLNKAEKLRGERPLIAVAENESLVNPCREWYSKEGGGRGHQNRNHLNGMPHNVLWLRVALGCLVKELYRRHFSAPLWNLDPITKEHRPAIESINAGHSIENCLYPTSG
jgi:hypothetical protein